MDEEILGLCRQIVLYYTNDEFKERIKSALCCACETD
jgi:hypothetical protein